MPTYILTAQPIDERGRIGWDDEKQPGIDAEREDIVTVFTEVAQMILACDYVDPEDGTKPTAWDLTLEVSYGDEGE